MDPQMTKTQEAAWNQGYAQGMRQGLSGDPATNPYPKNTLEYETWIQGAQQGYQDS